jgi:hypothetical protein
MQRKQFCCAKFSAFPFATSVTLFSHRGLNPLRAFSNISLRNSSSCLFLFYLFGVLIVAQNWCRGIAAKANNKLVTIPSNSPWNCIVIASNNNTALMFANDWMLRLNCDVLLLLTAGDTSKRVWMTASSWDWSHAVANIFIAFVTKM